jgi:glyceraldehyde 3-phosphate dehydrogenase
MAVRVGINGFGRIGRQVLKIGLGTDKLEFCAVNDITDAGTLALLFKRDSIYGAFDGTVEASGSDILVNGKAIKVFSERDPAAIPWSDVGAEIVVEGTGLFRAPEKAALHMKGGAKKVIITAPAKGEPADASIVMGVNHEIYDGEKHHIIDNASCTTNAFAQVVKVLHENYTIKGGLMTTIHSYTNDQMLLDGPHKDLRRARAAALSMIPTSTGAAKAIGGIFPDLKGKIDAFAIRVPTPTGSIVDFNCVVEKSTTAEEVNAKMKEAAEGAQKGFLGYTEEPLVLTDIMGDPRSGVFDPWGTKVQGGTLIKTLTWYDNEWGYSARVIDLLEYMAERM